MTLYLKSPRGLLNLHTLEKCIEQRLNFYDNADNSLEEISNFEYLVEDSLLDRTGHYFFRLYAFVKVGFRQTFLKYELKLLHLRLNSYTKGDFKYFLKRTISHSKQCISESGVHASVKEIYIFLMSLCTSMFKQDYLNHIFGDNHIDNECKKFILKVPFYQCASLIGRREVNLNKGNVKISCCEWKKLLLSVYETFLLRCLFEMNYNQTVQLALNDYRIKDCFKIIENHQSRPRCNNSNVKFDIQHIDAESKFFPLCMLNLYQVLQMTNRLSHNERYDFSLYLKGVGVTLEDSLRFWENAYTKQHSSCSKCSHNWKDSAKRYIYGIRHLYGLEGSRRNYFIRSCDYYQQSTISATGEGGCPFKHFDDGNLRRVLKKLLPDEDDGIRIMIHERKTDPSKSCKLFYETVFTRVSNKNIEADVTFINPVEYYLSLKNAACKKSF